MTYCTAIKLHDGLIFASDTRTNAGIDHISTFRKLYQYGDDERFIVVQTSGNLATSQAVFNRIEQDIKNNEHTSLLNTETLFDAAMVVGTCAREVAKHSQTLAQQSKGFASSFLLGGQIAGQPHELYNIYPEGNCVTATQDTHFFQIGESKYGKPILDRSLNFESSMEEALRAVLVSFDSTIRSNLSVGFPIDLVTYREGSIAASGFHPPLGMRITETDTYYADIRAHWSEGLKSTLAALPQVPEAYWQ